MNSTRIYAWVSSLAGVAVLAFMDREVFTAAELAFRGIAVGAIAGGGYLVGAEKTPPMNTK
jgi:hypothetical protein